ncbi:MAG: class I SAM-dependent methyltransferase [Candidatus Sungbacteria bacterium]|nr:class I SAM-dependent methyltransferase [Candidatus Sungbacteria bacterium]
MSLLEKLVQEHPLSADMESAETIEAKQAVLDTITPDVMRQLESQPHEICHHMAAVYTKTVDEYLKTKHNRDIIDELAPFMDMLPNGAGVLDVGCGPGRDTLFMSVADQNFRLDWMGRERDGKTTREKYAVPKKVFKVVGIDVSEGMLERANKRRLALEDLLLLDPFEVYPFFLYADMHAFVGGMLQGFDGIWSCTSLFTHTPYGLLETAMNSVSQALKSGGIFFASYTNGRGGKYDNLRVSRTGEIKYFSQPDPDEIKALAGKFGLILTQESFSDFELNGKVIKKDLFASQFFRKE